MLNRNNRSRFLVCTLLFIAALLTPSLARAQWDYFSGCIVMPDGFSPAANGIFVKVLDSNGFEVGGGSTDGIDGPGCFRAFMDPMIGGPFFDDDYTIVIKPSESPLFPGNGAFLDLSNTSSYSSLNSVYVSPDYVMPLSTIQLLHASRTFRVRVTEGAVPGTGIDKRALGDPVSGLDLFVSNDSSGADYFVHTRTDPNGDAIIAAPLGLDEPYLLWHSEVDLSEIFMDIVAAPGSGETLIDLVVVKGDQQLDLNLYDAFGSPFHVPPGIDGWAACKQFLSDGNKIVFATEVTSGVNSVSLLAADGTYECYVDIPTDASYTSVLPVSVPSVEIAGAPGFADVSVYQATTQMRLRGLNTVGDVPITDSCLEFELRGLQDGNGYPMEHYAYRTTGQGEVAIDVVEGGLYEARVNRCPGVQGNGSNYLIPKDIVPITVPVGSTNIDVNFPITASNASVTVTLVGPDGSPIPGFIEAFSPVDVTAPEADPKPGHARAATDPDEEIWIGEHTTGGPVTLSLVAGRKFFINAFPDFNETDPFIPPTEIELELQAGESPEFTVQALRPNHTLSVSLEFEEGVSASDFEFLGCFGYTSDGRQSFAEVGPGESPALPLLVNGKDDYWHIGCHAVLPESAEFLFFIGDGLYEPDEKSSFGSITVSMREEGTFYEEECWDFNVGRDTTFVLQDGVTRVEIPSGAFGDSGSAEMCVESGTGYTFSEEEYPVLTFDLKFTVNGESVTEPSRPVNIWFPVDRDRLAGLGATVDDLVAGSFNETAKTWQQDAGAEVREEDGVEYFVVPVSHFSIWGTLISVAQQIRKLYPTNLKAKKFKKKNSGGGGKQKMLLSWIAPEGAEDDQVYEVEYYKITKKTKKTEKGGGDVWESAKEIETVGTSLKRKLRKGKYSFRVRVKDGKDIPQPKNFKVK